MLLKAGRPMTLGGDRPRVIFGEGPKAAGAWAGSRVLLLDDEPAFELSYWCGTCQLLFERLEGADDTLSIDALQQRLVAGPEDVDRRIVERFGALLGKGKYLPLLLTIEPLLVLPAHPGDYFTEEQVATWGFNLFTGAPEHPGTSYYRTFQTKVAPSAHLYEFVVPMVPPERNDRARVDQYASLLEQSSKPTAVAVATLDICAPATDGESVD